MIKDWLKENSDVLSIKGIEGRIKCPATTLSRALNSDKDIPDKWIVPLEKLALGIRYNMLAPILHVEGVNDTIDLPSVTHTDDSKPVDNNITNSHTTSTTPTTAKPPKDVTKRDTLDKPISKLNIESMVAKAKEVKETKEQPKTPGRLLMEGSLSVDQIKEMVDKQKG